MMNLFNTDRHYEYFINKAKEYVAPRCQILSWCLVPTNFSFLVYANSLSAEAMGRAGIPTQYLTEGIRLMLSGYTKGFNREAGISGNLFQQKTKAKRTSSLSDTLKVSDTTMWRDYSVPAFYYIHQKPIMELDIPKMEDWPFSSFRAYCNLARDPLSDPDFTRQLLHLNIADFYQNSYHPISQNLLKNIFYTPIHSPSYHPKNR